MAPTKKAGPAGKAAGRAGTTKTSTGAKASARKGAPAKTAQPKPAAKPQAPAKAAKTTKPKAKAVPAAAKAKPTPAARKPGAKAVVAPKAAPAKPAAGKAASPKAAAQKASPAAAQTPAPAKPAKRKGNPAGLTPKDLEAVKAELIANRATLEKEFEDLEIGSLHVAQSELSGEVSFDEEYADAGTFTFERERDLSLSNNIRDLMDKVDTALRRIADGTYGACERCGNPIDKARLKALPYSVLCISCKQREERIR